MEEHRGIALKLINSKSGISNKEIINSYYRVAQEKGSVWYSTRIPISNKRQFEKVLFVVHRENEEIYIIADILETNIKPEPFTLDDCKALIPKLYQEEKRKTWLHITNMTKVGNEYTDNAIVYYSNGSEKNVCTIMHQQHVNRVYYTWKNENNPNNQNNLI